MVSNFEPRVKDTNEGMDEICSNPTDTSVSDFFGKKKRIRKLMKVQGKATKLQLTVMVVEWMRKMENDTSENGEQAQEHSERTKVVTRLHEKITAAALSYKLSIN